MCGIIGVAGVPDASRITYLGLYSLQHRGQESAGMVAVDGAGVARSHRSMGLVSDVFSETALVGMPGDVAIGHTRYSTAGSSVLANAQPILAGYREGPLALAHNGNLTNAEALRSDLVAKGSIFQTSSDSEVLIHLIARSEARELEDQLLDALERVEGAYSLVVTIGRTLYAIVDPRGFRPLWLGKLGNGYVVASETCANSCAFRGRRRRSIGCRVSRRSHIDAASSSWCTSRGPTARSSAGRSIACAAPWGASWRASTPRPVPTASSRCPTPRTRWR